MAQDTNIALYIEQIEYDRDRLKMFIKETLGGTPASPEKLTQLVDWFMGTTTTPAGFVIQGSPTATVTEGTSYTIQKGWYNGGTITGIAGGGNYTLQDKTVTPTKSKQTVNSDESYYGLGTVTINAIPSDYQDVTGVTATAGDVLAGKKYVVSDGTLTTGTMANNGNVSKTLDATTGNQSYTVPAGYHGGSGKVQIVLETKTATPMETAQTITPTSGKVLSTVIVNAIPDNYVDVTDATEVDTTTAQYVPTGTVLYGKDANGEPSKVTGTATKYNAKTVVLDCTKSGDSYTNTSEDIEKGYHEAGSVSIVPQTKTVTSSNTAQTVTADSGKVLASVTVNAMASATISNPTVDTTTGLITTSVTTGGYVASGTKKTTQLTVQSAKTITPSTSSQTAVAKNVYTTGVITVGAIPSKYGDTSTTTATASDILYGKIAFGKDSSGSATKLTGTMVNNGNTSQAINPLVDTEWTIPSGYTTGGTITLTTDLETLLANI